ncbi:facilitated trehalose transporter Tret1-like isoform X2 [Colias croceus]|uniref:facilitated trehalose transporter Tret1-like isoform X2 n=1 Tax=Colias crocea TaxID=72248 RepID=UPI001E28144A|nr:facilitated trehalose transporter Tret1-like isoform X2 [Colias croceus]
MKLYVMEDRRYTQYAVTSALALVTTTSGLASGWFTPMMSPLVIKHRTSIDVDGLDTWLWWISFLPSPGYMFGSLLTLFVCDRFGRRPTVLFSALFFLIAMIFSAAANKAWMLCFAVFLWGIGSGIVSVVIIVYVSEIADQGIRGRLIGVTSFMGYIGSLFIVGIGSLVSYKAFNYWLPLMPVLYFAACYSIPESPYYLIRKDKIEEARDALMRLRGDCSDVGQELERMISHVKKEMQHSTSIFELFRRIIYVKAIVIVFGFKLLQQISGTVSYYHFYSRILGESTFSISMENLIIIVLGVQAVAGILAAILVDSLGRRRLLICSFIGASISIAITAAYFFIRDTIPVSQILKSIADGPLFSILLFVFFAEVGLNSIEVVLKAEMFPINVRITAIVASNLFGSISIPINQLYYIAEYAIGIAGCMGVYALVALIGVIFTYFMLPETNGKSLSEIQDLLQGKKNKNQEITNIDGIIEI